MCLAPYGRNLKGVVDVPDVLLLFFKMFLNSLCHKVIN